MPLVVDVPLNTAIADLDEALRKLLRRELERHGFEGVEIAFDAPSKDWSGKLTSPTVDLFLYDLREALDRAAISPSETRGNGQSIVTPPPLRLELTYSVTAFTKAVEDEHRLLSQVLSILYSHKRLPADVLSDSSLNGGSVLSAADTSVGRPREEKADFWSSVGGTYKASIDYVVHITVESGATFVRGPEVRTQTIRARISDGPARTMTEMTRIGGTLSNAAGEPIPNAWVAVPDAGLWAVSDAAGRYRFDRIRPGSHRVIARTADGDETEATIEVPGAPADLVMGSEGRAGAKGRATRKK